MWGSGRGPPARFLSPVVNSGDRRYREASERGCSPTFMRPAESKVGNMRYTGQSVMVFYNSRPATGVSRRLGSCCISVGKYIRMGKSLHKSTFVYAWIVSSGRYRWAIEKIPPWQHQFEKHPIKYLSALTTKTNRPRLTTKKRTRDSPPMSKCQKSPDPP